MLGSSFFYSTLAFEWDERLSYERALLLEFTLAEMSCFFVTDPTPLRLFGAGLGIFNAFFDYFFCYLTF